jgi:hypothetical protein
LGTPRGTNLINALTSSNNIVLTYSSLIPAPPQPWGSTLSVMDGANPNGLWPLYYRNQSQLYGGTNYNGWFLNLTTANPVGFAADNELYVNTTINSQSYGNATNVNVAPGSLWHTTLAVTNYGPSLSSNVFVLDTLPDAPGVILVSSNTTQGSITNFGGALVWSLNNLAVNAGGSMTLNFLVSSNGVYTNSASVSAITTDPNPDDDSIAVVANVAPTLPVIVPFVLTGSGGGFKLSVTNDAGATVVIQASTNLFTWLPIFTNVAPFSYTNFDTTNFPMRFYRAVVGP